MKTFSPDLYFKGNRSYVHGTTLYQEIMDGSARTARHPAEGPVRIDIRGLLKNQGHFHFQTGNDVQDAPADITANFSVGCGNQTVTGWVIDAHKPVVRRTPYNESLIWDNLKLKESQIEIDGHPPFDAFEICASMAVRLHNHLFPPETGKKWLLSRIEFDHGIDNGDLDGLSLKYLQTIANRFTKTEVRNGKEVFGLLYFSLAAL